MSPKRAAKRRSSASVKLSASATRQLATAAYWELCYNGVTGHGPPRVLDKDVCIPIKGWQALDLAKLTGRTFAPKERPGRQKRAKARK